MTAPKPSAKPQTSCSACQKARQKCDKKTPTCSRCERHSYACERPELIRLWTTDDMVPRHTSSKKKDKPCKSEPYHHKKAPVLSSANGHHQNVPPGPPTPVSPLPPSTPSPPSTFNTFPIRHRNGEHQEFDRHNLSLPVNIHNMQSSKSTHANGRREISHSSAFIQYMPLFPSPPHNPYEMANGSQASGSQANSPQHQYQMAATPGVDAGIFTSPLDSLAEWIWQDQMPLYAISRKLDEGQDKDPKKFFKWLLNDFEQRIRDGSPRGSSLPNCLPFVVSTIELEILGSKDERQQQSLLMESISGIRNDTTQVIPLGMEQQYQQNNIQKAAHCWVKLYISIYYNLWGACKDIEHMLKITTMSESQILEPWSNEMWMHQLFLTFPEYAHGSTLINRILNVISGKKDISNNTNLETLLYSWILANRNAPRRPLDIGYQLFQSLVDELRPIIFSKLYAEFSQHIGKMCMNPISSLMLQYMIGSLVNTQPQNEVQMIIQCVLNAFSYWLSPVIAKKELVLNFVKMLKNAGPSHHSFLVARLGEAFGASPNNPDAQRDFVQCVIRMQTYKQWLDVKCKSRGMPSHRDYTKEGAEILWELLTLAEDDNALVVGSFCAQKPMEFYSLICYINTPTDSRAVSSERFRNKTREVIDALSDQNMEQMSPPPPTPIQSHSSYMDMPNSAGGYFVMQRPLPSTTAMLQQSPSFHDSVQLPLRNGFQIDGVQYQSYSDI